jgi:hypothetical protein
MASVYLYKSVTYPYGYLPTCEVMSHFLGLIPFLLCSTVPLQCVNAVITAHGINARL